MSFHRHPLYTTELHCQETIRLYTCSPYVASGGGYVSTHLKAHKLHGILTCLGAADVKTESQLEECVFTVLDAKDPSCSSVVTYGQHLILADQHGLVMNNKNGGVTGYIGPRPADNRGSIVLCFINAADEKGCIGKAVQFGDNGVAIDIVKSNRFRTDYNKRLTNFKKVTSNLKAGYLCCDGQGFPLTFGIRRDQRSHVTVLKSIFHEQHTKQAAADDKKRLQEEEEDAKSLVQQSMDVIEGLGEEQQEFLQLSCLGLSVRNWIPLLLFLCALFLFNLTPRQIAGLVCASIGVLFLFSQDKKQRAQAAIAAKAVLDPPPYSVEEDGNSAVSQQEQEQKQQRVIVIFEGQEHVVPSQFLVAEQHNIANAKTRYLSTLQWRTEQNIDTLLQKKPQYFEQFKKHSVQYVHNRDKQGHIVYIERPKSFNLEALNALGINSTTDVEQHYLFLFEYLWSVQDVTGTGKSLSIIDVEGIGARDAAGGVLASIKRVSGLTQRHYPNRAYMIFIINTPFWFSSIWKVISPLLNEHTRNKVKICRGLSTYQDLLLEQIESANLPRIYGGTCDCKDCTRDSPLERELWDYVAALPVAQEGKTQPPQESKSATNTAAAAAAVQPGVVLLSTAEDEDEDEELPVKRLG